MARVALLFPGQGAQEVGMGRRLCESLPAAREVFERANQILGYDLAKLCFEGPKEQLDSTVHSQPALFVTSLAALEWLKANKPQILAETVETAGLSLGEYTALVFAGAMDFVTGLRVVQERGRAMQAAADQTPSGMVSILVLDREKIAELCEQAKGPGEVMQIANLLCPGNIAVSGSKAACAKIAELAQAAGAKTVPLAVAGAFHTPIMQPAVERLTAVLQTAKIVSPRVPVISNVDAAPHSDPEEIRQLLVKQVVSPVRWEDSIRRLIADGCDLFYEVGAGRVLRGILKRIDRKAAAEGTDEI